LNENTNREYNPRTGRYAQVDPLGLTAGPNPYLYGDANPLSVTDSLGLMGQGSGANAPKTQTTKPPVESCPTDHCENTITVHTGGVCAPGDTMCPQAMAAAGIQPPYTYTTKTYDWKCILKLGITVKGTSAAAGYAAGKYGPGLLARGFAAAGAPVVGAYAGAAGTTAAAISSGPIGITFTLGGAAAYLAGECECKAGQKQ